MSRKDAQLFVVLRSRCKPPAGEFRVCGRHDMLRHNLVRGDAAQHYADGDDRGTAEILRPAHVPDRKYKPRQGYGEEAQPGYAPLNFQK